MRGMKPFKLFVASTRVGYHRSAADNGKPSKGVALESLGLSSGSQLGVGDIHTRKIGKNNKVSQNDDGAAGYHRSAADNRKLCNGVTLKSLVLSSGCQLGVGDIHTKKVGKKHKVSQDDGTAKALENINGILRNVVESEEEMESALQKTVSAIDPYLVEKVLCMHVNNWKIAYGFFVWAGRQPGYQHTTEVCNAMVNILGKVKQFDIAWEVIEQMSKGEKEGSSVTAKTFGIMFRRYAAAHMVKEAVEAFHRMGDFNLEPDRTAFHSLINFLCEHNHVEEAEHMSIGKDSKFSPDTKTFNILLTGWCKRKAWQECKRFWKEANEIDSFCPNLFSYSIFMDVLAKSGNPKKALRLFQEMEERGIQPDVTVYNILIHVLGQVDRVNESLQVMPKMLEIGCRPNVMTYNSLIRNLCIAGRMHKAYRLLEQMVHQRCIPNATTYHFFFSKLGRPKETLELFDRMVRSGCVPAIDTYVLLMRKFGRWGLLRVVFIIWNQMQQRGCSPDKCAYEALIYALNKRGRFSLARKYREEMVARGLSLKPRRDVFPDISSVESGNEDS